MQCPKYSVDDQGLKQTIMAFQAIFRWDKSLVHVPGKLCVDPGIVIGQYEIDRQEAKDMKDVLIGTVFGKVQQALLGLWSEVEAVMAGTADRQLWDFEEGETAGTKSAIQPLLQTTISLTFMLNASKSFSKI